MLSVLNISYAIPGHLCSRRLLPVIHPSASYQLCPNILKLCCSNQILLPRHCRRRRSHGRLIRRQNLLRIPLNRLLHRTRLCASISMASIHLMRMRLNRSYIIHRRGSVSTPPSLFLCRQCLFLLPLMLPYSRFEQVLPESTHRRPAMKSRQKTNVYPQGGDDDGWMRRRSR
ncbi:hypothetical protein M440DRAFT_1065151 [Trichoderma longibrachiatum ATCC 18648]|uniref:Uncharacterized protein n=1 Tax=Trichoderma longibrachiatum ATCC 18648 TaxID=983965 RepID=A0A2T4BW65_TRILO|nr:hypothetical protein M440DRAFT_1065151 [Trichoderma longibrachiatum ATCC 18648]